MATKKRKKLEEINKITPEWLKAVIVKLDTEDENGEKSNATYFHRVANTDYGTGLYIVVGWSDGFDEAPKHTKYAEGTYRICAKIGYASGTAGITGYEEFYMPYDPKTGVVDDTDSEVHPTKKDAEWLNKEAKRIWNEYKDVLDALG